MDLQYVANLVFPVTLSFHILHPSPVPPILPSGRCIRVVWEDQTSCFLLVLSLSAISVLFLHMLPRCHLLQTLSPRPVKSTIKKINKKFFLRSDRDSHDVEINGLAFGHMAGWNVEVRLMLISADLQWCHRVGPRQLGSRICIYSSVTHCKSSESQLKD